MSLDALQGSCWDRLAIVTGDGGLALSALPDAMRTPLSELLASALSEEAEQVTDLDGSHTDGS
jgi:hypothetical protein